MNPDNITPPQPQLPGHHVSNSMKIVMLLLGLALIATLGYFTWFVGSEQEAAEEVAPSVKEKTEETATTSDETADWKTYTNTTLALTIKYPADWTLGNQAALDSATDLKKMFSGGASYLQLVPTNKIKKVAGQDDSWDQKLEIFITPTNLSTIQAVVDKSIEDGQPGEKFTEERNAKLGLNNWAVGQWSNESSSSAYQAFSVITKQYAGFTEKYTQVVATGYSFSGSPSSKFDSDFAKISEKILTTLALN